MIINKKENKNCYFEPQTPTVEFLGKQIVLMQKISSFREALQLLNTKSECKWGGESYLKRMNKLHFHYISFDTLKLYKKETSLS